MRGLHPVYLVQCPFLLYSLFLYVAYAAEASFDKKGLLEAVQVRWPQPPARACCQQGPHLQAGGLQEAVSVLVPEVPCVPLHQERTELL